MQQSGYLRFLYGALAPLIIFVFLLLGNGQALGQTLDASDNVPTMDLCGAVQTFTVKIEKGPNSCSEGVLRIAMPVGMVYEAGSATISEGTFAPGYETVLSESSVELVLPTIAAGVPSGTVVITYQARARCELYNTANREVTYTLTGCTGGPDTENSNAINIRNAYLSIDAIASESGIIGQNITRNIVVRNTGNGAVNGFTLKPTYGTGLTRIGTTSPGWTWDATNEVYTYSGTIPSSGTVTLIETVEITGCGDIGVANLLSTYRAYWGCDDECTVGSGPTINAQIGFANITPNLTITHSTPPTIACLDQFYPHTWTITNTGTGIASDIELLVGTDGGEAYIDETSFTLGNPAVTGMTTNVESTFPPGNPFGNGGKTSLVKVNIPELGPGQSTTITFNQYYAAPLTDPSQCETLPTSFSVANTHRSATYKSYQICDEGAYPTYSIAQAVTKAAQTYAFSGSNIGELDVVEGQPYTSDFRIDDWTISGEGLGAGAFFEFFITVSPDLSITDPTTSGIRIFNGTDYLDPAGYTVTAVAGGYTVRIASGSTLWPVGQALSFGGGSWRLQFPLQLDHCPGADENQWYSVQARFNKGGSCPPSQLISFQCQKVDLYGHCLDGNCLTGGMLKSSAFLKRITLGYPDANNDGFRDSETPYAPGDDLSTIQPRSFIGGDIVEIAQVGTVVGGTAMPVGGWAQGTFVVTAPASLNSVTVANSGKIVVTRGGTPVHTASNLPVNSVGNSFNISLAGFAYQPGDVVTASLQIEPRRLDGSAELLEFPTDYYFSDGSDNYSCGRQYRATGYYAPVSLSTSVGGSANVTGCEFQGRTYTINLSIAGRSSRNALFINEFREIARPTATEIEVPAGLVMTGYRVQLNNNASGTVAPYVQTGLSVTGGSVHTINQAKWEEILTAFKGASTVGWLDEGYSLVIAPVVTPQCDAPANTQNIRIRSTMDGTFRTGSTNIYADTHTTGWSSLSYTLNNSALEALPTSVTVNTISAQASWIVRIRSNSGTRSFDNVWIGKESASNGLNIIRVEPVANSTSTTPIGPALAETNGVFEIGPIAAGNSNAKYFLVTGEFDHCGSGTVQLAFGSDCAGYPAAVSSATCKNILPNLNLEYIPETAKLQTAISIQPAGSNIPQLCEAFDYRIEINNAGGEAKDITLSLPLAGTVGLSYNPNTLKVSSSVYTTAQSNPTMVALDDSHITENILITIPASSIPKLGKGERFYIDLQLISEGCDFKSGQRVSFTPAGNNFCGSEIEDQHITGVISNRVIIKGAPENAPYLAISSQSSIDLVSSGSDLTATYNFTLTNTGGEFGEANTSPATGTVSGAPYIYEFSIKLPANWVFAVHPQTLVPTHIAEFTGLDPIRGYVFKLGEDLTVSNEIKIENAKLRYTGTDAPLLSCGHNFGDITESAYTMFTPESICVPTVDCQIEHVSAENKTNMVLSQPVAPTGDATQVFCETDNVTLADIVLSNAGSLKWFASASATDIDELAPGTSLVNGTTYYAANGSVDGSLCLSDRLAVTVTLMPQSIANAGPDQTVNNGTSFILQGSDDNPASSAPGEWSIVFVSGTTLSQVVLNNPTSPNAEVIMPIGAEVHMRWTLNAGTCSSSDEVVLRSVVRPITAEDDRYDTVTSLEVNGKTGTSAPLPSVLDNPHGGTDDLDGSIPTTTPGPNQVVLTPGTPNHPNLSMDNQGRITVAANTPKGIYQFPYTICEVANPANCAEAVAYIKVGISKIEAIEDKDGDYGTTGDPINGYTGGKTPSVLDNDELNDVILDPKDVTLTPGTPDHSGLTMNPDGTITVAPGTPAGTYEYPYTICEKLNPDNCSTNKATVIVGTADIEANDNGVYIVNGSTGEPNVGNALTNDRLNGQPVTSDKITTTVIGTQRKDIGAPDGNYATATGTVPQLDTETGIVSVPPGTLPGVYRIEYRICEVLNPTINCDNAFITVQVNPTPIEANDNTYGPVKGNEGNSNLGNVLPNDIYDGRVPTVEDVILTSTTTPPGTNPGDPQYPYIYTNPTDPSDPKIGTVIVPPGTPDGNYTIPYTICEVLNPANCSTANVTVTVAESTIDAIDDLYPAVNSRNGGTTSSVLDNDLLNGTVVDPDDITLTPGTSPHTGISMDPATGIITIAAGTPAGTYQYPYQICEVLNTPPGNCDNAIATIIVTADPIVADNDSFGPFNGGNTSTSTSILDNDSFNTGDPLNPVPATLANVDISIVHPATPIRTGTPVPTLNPADGLVTVQAGTPAGEYHITYRICETINPTNCDDAIITVVVAVPEIVANDNDYRTSDPVNGFAGGDVSTSVVIDDKLNNVDLTAGDIGTTITLTPGTRPHPGISMDAQGVIHVAAGTPAGTYHYTYTICEILNPTNCDNATATILVNAPNIVAADDHTASNPLGTVNGYTGGKTTANVFTNDNLNDTLLPNLGGVLTDYVIFTPLVSSDPRIMMNGDGTITVAPGTPAGSYTHTYRICEVLNPTNCDEATAWVIVTPTDIDAVNDDYAANPANNINGATGSTYVGNAMANDLLNSTQAIPGQVFITNIIPATPINGEPVPVLDPLTGVVSVPAGTPADVYTIRYTICEVLNPTNCDVTPAVITVRVTAPPIMAIADHYSGATTAEGNPNMGNILVNDELNGRRPVVGGTNPTVTLTVQSTLLGGNPVADPNFAPQIDASGIVSVPAGTPAGTYIIPYEICEVLNPGNCANTTATVVVGRTQILAMDNEYGPVIGLQAKTLGNALRNDIFNLKDNGLQAFTDGKIAIATPLPTAILQPGSPVPPAAYAGNMPMLSLDGTVSIPAMTPQGTYVIEYDIYEVADPTNHDKATITIEVIAALIDPDDDFIGNVDGIAGSSNVDYVLKNDKLNGLPVNLADVEITVLEDAQAVPGAPTAYAGNLPELNTATGIVSVPDHTPAGEYHIRYRICEVLNPTNCDHATVKITVVVPQIKAIKDSFDPVNSTTGNPSVGNVLDNDRYNGGTTAATLSEVSLQVVQPARSVPGAVNNLVPFIEADGNVKVLPATPEGTYQIQYEICDLVNPTNCDKAIVTVVVFASVIKAEDDYFGPVIGMDGSPVVGNVLDNDRFNSPTPGSANISNVSIEVLTPAAPNHEAGDNKNVPVLNPATGEVSVPQGTPAGDYQIRYHICDLLNPTHCDEAIVTVEVKVAPIDAVDDNFGPINGYEGGTTTSVLYDNDELNNAAITAVNQSNIIFTPDMDGPYPGKLTFNTDGTITVAPQTEAGTYRWWYTICEALNPYNCDRAVATITVAAAPILAVDDNFTLTIERFGSKTPSVLDNDELNNAPIKRDEITLTPGIPSHPGLNMNADGTIDIESGMKVGTYTYPYTICEVLNPSNCDDAVATIVITAEDLFIPNTYTPNGDGKNDTFEIIGWEAYDRIELVVFNRWGNEVYRNVDYDNSWTGIGLNDGTYYYMVKLIKGNTTDTRKGWILIKRN